MYTNVYVYIYLYMCVYACVLLPVTNLETGDVGGAGEASDGEHDGVVCLGPLLLLPLLYYSSA